MASDWGDVPELPAELEGAMSDLGRFWAEYRAGGVLLWYLLLGLVLLVLGAAVGPFFVVRRLGGERHVGVVELMGFSAALTAGGAVIRLWSVPAACAPV